MQIDFDAGGIGSDTVCNPNCGSSSGYYQHEDQNRLIIMGLFLSMAFGIVLGGMPRIIQVLLNISIPVIMLYLFYLIGVLGAGDIKLFSVIGGFTNLKTLTAKLSDAHITFPVKPQQKNASDSAPEPSHFDKRRISPKTVLLKKPVL